MIRSTLRPAIFPASLVHWRWVSLKCAGTVITASLTGSPRYSSATCFISRRMIAASSGQVNAFPPISTRGSSFAPRTIS